MKLRVLIDGETIGPDETFTWQEDGSATERRRLERKRQIRTTCVGVTLALVVLGHAFGISWLIGAVASGETTSARLK